MLSCMYTHETSQRLINDWFMRLYITCQGPQDWVIDMSRFVVAFFLSLSVFFFFFFSLLIYYFRSPFSHLSFLVTSPELDGHPLGGKFYIQVHVHVRVHVHTYMCFFPKYYMYMWIKYTDNYTCINMYMYLHLSK